MFNKKIINRIKPLLGFAVLDFKIFCFAMLIILTGCNNQETRSDITKLLGLIDIQNHEGYKKCLNGKKFNIKNEKQWLAAELLFKKSDAYLKSNLFLIDSLIKDGRLNEVNKRLNFKQILAAADTNEIINLHLTSQKFTVLMLLNDYESFKYLESQSSITNWKDNNQLLRVYFYLKYNLFRVDKFVEEGLYEEAIVFGQLGLFLLESHELSNELSKLYMRYCLATSYALLENNDKNNLELSILYLKKAFEIEQNHLEKEHLSEIAANLEYALIDAYDTISAKRYTNIASEMNAVQKGLDFYISGDYHNAKIQYLKHIDLLKEKQCKIEKFQVYGYLAELHAEQYNFDSASYYLDKAYDFEHCGEYIQNESAYHVHEIRFLYLKKLDSLYKLNFTKIIDPLLKRRELGYKVLLDASSSHMSDFLIMNTTRYLSCLRDRFGGDIPPKYQREVINLVGEAKRTKSFIDIKKANKFKKHASDISFLKQKIEKIRFKGIHSDSSYYKLGMLYSNISNISKVDSIPELDIKIRNDIPIINFVYNVDSYWMYLKNGNDMYLKEYPTDSINFYVDAILNNVKNDKTNSGSINKKFKDYLNLDEINNESVTILPDGDLIGFPFCLLFRNGNVSISYNYGLYNTEYQKTVLKIDDGVGLVSYSDDTTYNTLDTLEYSELINGYEECVFVRDSLFPYAELIAGHEFTKSNFENFLNNEILHISSHALSNELSKYETSILLRDNLGQPSSFYGYELLNYKVPKFIFLNACETGVGYIQVGDGVYSFARYCQMAGSNTVISTLWKVKDKAASQFSQSFYTSWLSGKSALEAFTEAQNRLRELNDDPNDWAPFVLEGNPNVYLSKN